jgi:hypothetical protein
VADFSALSQHSPEGIKKIHEQPLLTLGGLTLKVRIGYLWIEVRNFTAWANRLCKMTVLGALRTLWSASWNRTVRPPVYPYTWNNTRTDKPILIKFDTGEFYEELLGHFNFNSYGTVLTSILHNSFYELILHQDKCFCYFSRRQQ